MINNKMINNKIKIFNNKIKMINNKIKDKKINKYC
jgi:hypothetical protein